jgi:hypothetical protein
MQHSGLKLKEGVYIPPQVIDYPLEDPYAHLVKVEKSADTPDTYTFDETYPYLDDSFRFRCNSLLNGFAKWFLVSPWNRIKYGFQYSPNCSIWDMTDLIDYLIVKLTVMGVYHGGAFSHVLYHKQKMHTIWQARKMLIEAISAEDIYTYAKNLELKEQFHLDKDYFELVDT